MNKNRRKQLDALQDRIIAAQTKLNEFLELSASCEDIHNEIESLKDEEQDYIDNLPENLQQSEKASDAEAAVNSMEEAMDALSEYTSSIDTLSEALQCAVDAIDNAKGQA